MTQNAHQSNGAPLPPGMHARATTVAFNPGQLRSPAFGNSRAPFQQLTLEQLHDRAAVPVASSPVPFQMVVAVAAAVPTRTPPRRFEAATKDDPILLSPAKPKMRSLHLTHINLCE